MKLMTYHPAESIFDSFFRDAFDAFAPILDGVTRYSRPDYHMEWFKDDTHYYARIDLPGVKKDDLNLEFESDTVTISAKRGDRSYESRLRVPDGIEADGAKAELSDGVLTLTLPKAPEKKPVTIAID